MCKLLCLLLHFGFYKRKEIFVDLAVVDNILFLAASGIVTIVDDDVVGSFVSPRGASVVSSGVSLPPPLLLPLVVCSLTIIFLLGMSTGVIRPPLALSRSIYGP
jgi:hypothetical protein